MKIETPKLKKHPQTSKTKRSEKQRFHELRHYEREASLKGFKCIVGIDEAGRGPLAGPVVAAACLLPDGIILKKIDDSKKLTKEVREELFSQIIDNPSIIYGIGIVDNQTIDEINIYQATILAMKRALEALPCTPDHLLIDGLPLPGFDTPFSAIVNGDGKSASIAAASIIAKVTRDKIMTDYHEQWPQYNFKDNKGYATKFHLSVIQTYGVCPIHRVSWKPFQTPALESN